MNESQLRAERKNIGMIFQHFNLLSSRTVAENIAFPLELIGASKDVIEKKVASLLDLVVSVTGPATIRPSSRAARNSASASPVPWPATRKSCSATKPHRPWTRRRRSPSWNCSRTSINAWASPSSSSPMKWPSSRKSAIASPSSKAASSRKWAASSTSSPILSPRP